MSLNEVFTEIFQTNKPIMEKKRRERINKCLEDLKNIVTKATGEAVRLESFIF